MQLVLAIQNDRRPQLNEGAPAFPARILAPRPIPKRPRASWPAGPCVIEYLRGVHTGCAIRFYSSRFLPLYQIISEYSSGQEPDPNSPEEYLESSLPDVNDPERR
jgi:hypothetical protein